MDNNQHEQSGEQSGSGGNILLWRLARKRMDAGDTLQSAAAKLGISYPYLQALLGGQRPVERASKPVLAAISSYLDIPVAYFSASPPPPGCGSGMRSLRICGDARG